MRYAQLNPAGIVMNIVDIAPHLAVSLTTKLVPLLGVPNPPIGSRWDGNTFIPPNTDAT